MTLGRLVEVNISGLSPDLPDLLAGHESLLRGPELFDPRFISSKRTKLFRQRDNFEKPNEIIGIKRIQRRGARHVINGTELLYTHHSTSILKRSFNQAASA